MPKRTRVRRITKPVQVPDGLVLETTSDFEAYLRVRLREMVLEREMFSVPLADAAEILRLDPSTLRHQIRNGQLEARKFRGKWFVQHSAISGYWRHTLGRHGPRGKTQ